VSRRRIQAKVLQRACFVIGAESTNIFTNETGKGHKAIVSGYQTTMIIPQQR